MTQLISTLEERIENLYPNVEILASNGNVAVVYRDLIVKDHKRCYTVVASDTIGFINEKNWLDQLPQEYKDQCRCGIHQDIEEMLSQKKDPVLESLLQNLVGICRIEWDSSELYMTNPVLWKEIKERNGDPIKVRSYNIAIKATRPGLCGLKYIW